MLVKKSVQFLLPYLWCRQVMLAVRVPQRANLVQKQSQEALTVHPDPVSRLCLAEAESLDEKHDGKLYYFCPGVSRLKFEEQDNYKKI